MFLMDTSTSTVSEILCPDNYIEISNHINHGSTWKSWILVCKFFSQMNNSERRARYSNHLLTLLKLFPDQPGWDWYWISRNPNITWEIVNSHPDWPWSWNGLSRNPN